MCSVQEEEEEVIITNYVSCLNVTNRCLCRVEELDAGAIQEELVKAAGDLLGPEFR